MWQSCNSRLAKECHTCRSYIFIKRLEDLASILLEKREGTPPKKGKKTATRNKIMCVCVLAKQRNGRQNNVHSWFRFPSIVRNWNNWNRRCKAGVAHLEEGGRSSSPASSSVLQAAVHDVILWKPQYLYPRHFWISSSNRASWESTRSVNCLYFKNSSNLYIYF